MPHPAIENATGFAMEPIFTSDENGQPLLVVVLKATIAIGDGGRLSLHEKQVPVNIAGEPYGEPGKSSYKYEPETAPAKAATDVVVIADAYARHSGDTQVDVRFRAGSLDKTVRVTGDRYWLTSLGLVGATSPEPFESIPLTYERAFGGYDPDSTPEQPIFDQRNPVGSGYHAKSRKHDSLRLPNIEDPARPISGYDDRPDPAGFGFLSPDWAWRAKFAGTYDSAWMRDRMPLLPFDFDPKFYNAASPGLVAPSYLRGGETVSLTNCTPNGALEFILPAIEPSSCEVELRHVGLHPLEPRFDTLILNARERLLFQIGRARLALPNGAHDVASIRVRSAHLPAPGQEF
jgi:hypothetical protein